MSTKKPTSNLGAVLRRWRLVEDLELREVASQIGIGAATLMRIEHGHSFDAATMMKVWVWLMTTQAAGD